MRLTKKELVDNFLQERKDKEIAVSETYDFEVKNREIRGKLKSSEGNMDSLRNCSRINTNVIANLQGIVRGYREALRIPNSIEVDEETKKALSRTDLTWVDPRFSDNF